jgi:hypothetical protein
VITRPWSSAFRTSKAAPSLQNVGRIASPKDILRTLPEHLFGANPPDDHLTIALCPFSVFESADNHVDRQ